MESLIVEAPVNPRRSTSLQINERILTVRKSQSELKRSVSDNSHGPLRQVRAKMELNRKEREEQELEIQKADLEQQEGLLSTRDHKKRVKQMNGLIYDQDDDYWKLKKEARNLEEAGNLKPRLDIDLAEHSLGILLALYKPRKRRGRNANEQKAMTRECLEKYQSQREDGSDQYWCPIARQWFGKDYMKTAHIVPVRIQPEILDYIIGSGSSSQQYSAKNGLYMNAMAEIAFDRGSFWIVPADVQESPLKTFKIVGVPGHENAPIGNGLTMKDVHDKEVKFLTDFRPAKRYLFFNYLVQRGLLRRDRKDDSAAFLLDSKTSTPWPTIGPYIRKSMLPAISEAMGDDWDEFWAKIAGPNVFEDGSEERLEQDEKNRIAHEAVGGFLKREASEDEEGEDACGTSE